MNRERSQSIHNCELCNDTMWISYEENNHSYCRPCSCYFKFLKIISFGELFKDKNIDNYEPRNESMRKAKEIILANPLSSYLIIGNVGLGKTHLLAGIYDLIIANRNDNYSRILIYTESGLLDAIKEKRTEIENLNEYKHIIIDDIGKVSLASWDLEKFFNFYDTIYRNNKQLVISSNYSIGQLAEVYGGAITRRIEEMSTILEIRGTDNE